MGGRFKFVVSLAVMSLVILGFVSCGEEYSEPPPVVLGSVEFKLPSAFKEQFGITPEEFNRQSYKDNSPGGVMFYFSDTQELEESDVVKVVVNGRRGFPDVHYLSDSRGDDREYPYVSLKEVDGEYVLLVEYVSSADRADSLDAVKMRNGYLVGIRIQLSGMIGGKFYEFGFPFPSIERGYGVNPANVQFVKETEEDWERGEIEVYYWHNYFSYYLKDNNARMSLDSSSSGNLRSVTCSVSGSASALSVHEFIAVLKNPVKFSEKKFINLTSSANDAEFDTASPYYFVFPTYDSLTKYPGNFMITSGDTSFPKPKQ